MEETDNNFSSGEVLQKKLDVIHCPDPLLKKASTVVEEVDDQLRAFLDDMLHTMYQEDGIGLAAVQVGVLKRVLVTDVGESSSRYPGQSEGKSTPLYIINPEILAYSDDVCTFEEGCLSFPGQRAVVERPSGITISYIDYYGKPQELEADGLLARCLQHEIDHLNGVTFVDHISRLKRDMIIKRMRKINRIMTSQ